MYVVKLPSGRYVNLEGFATAEWTVSPYRSAGCEFIVCYPSIGGNDGLGYHEDFSKEDGKVIEYHLGGFAQHNIGRPMEDSND